MSDQAPTPQPEPDIDPESVNPDVPQYVFPFFNDTPD
jgi:hypothetical protein